MTTQTWDKSLEQLHSEVSDLEKSLNELKTATLSDVERKKKESEVKNKAEKLQWQIDVLSWQEWIDAKIVAERERAELLLKSCADTLSLQSSIWNTPTEKTKTDSKEKPVPTTSSETKPAATGTDKQKSNPEDENKWFFWKAKDWVWEQWNDVWDKDKWEKEWGKNLLRTAWFVATWVWAVSLAVKWIKKLFWKDKKKEKSWDSSESKDKKDGKKPRWKRFLLWSAIAGWTVIWWVALYKNWNMIKSKVKEKLWISLNFDEALVKVEDEVKNWKVDTKGVWTFRAHFEWMSYDASTNEISSFWQETKINKKNKTIEWMDNVQFASREELFHAVNIVNFAKRELAWRWATDSPFIKNDKTWDIDFNISWGWENGFISANWSDFRTKLLWVWWTWAGWLIGWYVAWIKWWLAWSVWGWLAWYAAWSLIDNTSALWRTCNTIAKGANLDRFVTYLNGLKIWEPKPQEKEQDDKSPIHAYLNQIIDEIEWARWPKEKRELSAEYDEKNPSEVVIKSYNDQKVKLKLEWNVAKVGEQIDFKKITKISLLRYAEDEDEKCDLDIDFPHNEEWLKEAIRVANFTNMIREKFKRSGKRQYPFWYWLYSTPGWLDMCNDTVLGTVNRWHTLLSHKVLKEKYPTILKDLQWSWASSFGTYFWTDSNQDKQHERAATDSPEWSQYIKYLNQMWQWEYRWNKG